MFAPLVSSLLLAAPALAFWRLPCDSTLILERGDPIVSLNAVAGHVHTVSGASGFSLSSTFEDLRASECTSCKVEQDLSAYWTPALYFQWANGSFSLVDQVGGGLIYYLPRRNSNTEKVLAFPDGFKMLTGNPFTRSYDASSLESQAIGWNCLGAPVAETRQPYLPPYNCPNGLRGEIRFPSCWDGVNLDSSDHKSHMAYPIGGESGPCPSTHPKRLVTLFYEMMWSVDPWKNLRAQGLNTSQPFVLAMGDPTGYGYHGDFLNGWDHDVLQTAIETCTSDSGVIELCDAFILQPSGSTCKKTPDVNEIVTGTLPTLPGCNAVTYGPNAATPQQCGKPTPQVFRNTTAYTGGAPPPGSNVLPNAPKVVMSYKNWQYQDCYSDLSDGTRALSKGVTNGPGTVGGCLDACAAQNFMLAGVEYGGECWCGNTLSASSSAIGYGYCSTPCRGDSLQYCGGGKALDLYKFSTTAPSSGVTDTTATTTIAISSATFTSTTAASTTSAFSATTTRANTRTKTLPATSASASATALVGKVTTNPNWQYSGCNADLVNGARSLPNSLSSDSTVDGCLAACQTAGYPSCGLSYYGECYGGNGLSRLANALPATSCQSVCRGSAAQTCGGAGALDVYNSTVVAQPSLPLTPTLSNVEGWTYSGCWSDLVNNVRSLRISATSNGTIEGCLAACSKTGTATACGVSYYGECYYSTSGLASSSSRLDESRCTFPCKKNGLEYCGGSAALSLYLPSQKRSLPGRRRELPHRL